MPQTFPFMITQAGLDALVDAQNGETEAIRVTEVGFTEQHVALAPTLEVLPGEFKRLDTISGQSASETVIHMTATDHSLDVYEVRAIGLFLADGTLFAAYSHPPSALFRKVDIANFLIAFDIVFSEAVGGDIEFGDATFLYPPATEVTKGVASLATQGDVDEGSDDEQIVTPLKLAQRLLPVLQSIVDEAEARTQADAAQEQALDQEESERQAADTALQSLINALRAITITGAGLATGGGNLTANRVINVLAATAAQVMAGVSNSVAITPASLGPIITSFGQSGYASVPGGNPSAVLLLQWGRFTAGANSSPSITFPIAFSAPAFAVVVDGTSDTNNDAQDNFPTVRTPTISATGFTAFNPNDSADQCCFFAVGQVDLT
ncbi:Phage-related tail fiber protein [Qipengyuania citrea LAMA 915]|uniref:Phage-related tail fiber protein n=1 Tax=Qipengyuania citrea LAMA 915 TaxID=1306953 RepID=A0A0L1KFE3_9SPHN|nr:hypothetical protein [Qipengyuania citrea]KNH02616.1 Phage-related tail fiber protein [Qipengyuania citrea LAMA 915]